MILSFSKKMIPNTGIRVCYTQDFHTITDFGANEEGLPLMILSDHFETAPFFIVRLHKNSVRLDAEKKLLPSRFIKASPGRMSP